VGVSVTTFHCRCLPRGFGGAWVGDAPVPADAPRQRIDHVLVSPDVAVELYAVLDDRPGGRHPSDHDPVVAALRFPARA